MKQHFGDVTNICAFSVNFWRHTTWKLKYIKSPIRLGVTNLRLVEHRLMTVQWCVTPWKF